MEGFSDSANNCHFSKEQKQELSSSSDRPLPLSNTATGDASFIIIHYSCKDCSCEWCLGLNTGLIGRCCPSTAANSSSPVEQKEAEEEVVKRHLNNQTADKEQEKERHKRLSATVADDHTTGDHHFLTTAITLAEDDDDEDSEEETRSKKMKRSQSDPVLPFQYQGQTVNGGRRDFDKNKNNSAQQNRNEGRGDHVQNSAIPISTFGPSMPIWNLENPLFNPLSDSYVFPKPCPSEPTTDEQLQQSQTELQKQKKNQQSLKQQSSEYNQIWQSRSVSSSPPPPPLESPPKYHHHHQTTQTPLNQNQHLQRLAQIAQPPRATVNPQLVERFKHHFQQQQQQKRDQLLQDKAAQKKVQKTQREMAFDSAYHRNQIEQQQQEQFHQQQPNRSPQLMQLLQKPIQDKTLQFLQNHHQNPPPPQPNLLAKLTQLLQPIRDKIPQFTPNFQQQQNRPPSPPQHISSPQLTQLLQKSIQNTYPQFHQPNHQQNGQQSSSLRQQLQQKINSNQNQHQLNQQQHLHLTRPPFDAFHRQFAAATQSSPPSSPHKFLSPNQVTLLQQQQHQNEQQHHQNRIHHHHHPLQQYNLRPQYHKTTHTTRLYQPLLQTPTYQQSPSLPPLYQQFLQFQHLSHHQKLEHFENHLFQLQIQRKKAKAAEHHHCQPQILYHQQNQNQNQNQPQPQPKKRGRKRGAPVDATFRQLSSSVTSSQMAASFEALTNQRTKKLLLRHYELRQQEPLAAESRLVSEKLQIERDLIWLSDGVAQFTDTVLLQSPIWRELLLPIKIRIRAEKRAAKKAAAKAAAAEAKNLPINGNTFPINPYRQNLSPQNNSFNVASIFDCNLYLPEIIAQKNSSFQNSDLQNDFFNGGTLSQQPQNYLPNQVHQQQNFQPPPPPPLSPLSQAVRETILDPSPPLPSLQPPPPQSHKVSVIRSASSSFFKATAPISCSISKDAPIQPAETATAAATPSYMLTKKQRASRGMSQTESVK